MSSRKHNIKHVLYRQTINQVWQWYIKWHVKSSLSFPQPHVTCNDWQRHRRNYHSYFAWPQIPCYNICIRTSLEVWSNTIYIQSSEYRKTLCAYDNVIVFKPARNVGMAGWTKVKTKYMWTPDAGLQGRGISRHKLQAIADLEASFIWYTILLQWVLWREQNEEKVKLWANP